MVRSPLPGFPLYVPVLVVQTVSPAAKAVVPTLSIWFCDAVPLALKVPLPLIKFVPDPQGVPLGALKIEIVAADPTAVSTRPMIAVIVEGCDIVMMPAFGVTPAIHPIGAE